jgi:hypothetical protein
MKKFLKIFLISIFIIFVLIIIAWRIDRTFFHPYQPDRSNQIRDDVTTLKFTVPKDKERCEAKGGIWKKMGPRPFEECNLKTTDAGKVCENSKECEGVCLANLTPEELSQGMRGKLFHRLGTCSDVIKVMGCRAYVVLGWASVVCAD